MMKMMIIMMRICIKKGVDDLLMKTMRLRMSMEVTVRIRNKLMMTVMMGITLMKENYVV